MHDQRNTHRFEATTSKLWPVLRCTAGHLAALDVGKIYPTFFKHVSLGQYPTNTATTLGTVPALHLKACRPINGTQLVTNRSL